MSIDEIFKKMKTVDLGVEGKRNPTRPERKEIKKFPEKSAMFKHRYGPEYEPEEKIILDIHEKSPLAFCRNCNAERQMKWKSHDERGKGVEAWFVCATCGYDKLEIKKLNMKGK